MQEKAVDRTYGRKVIRDGHGVRQTQKKNYARRFFVMMGVSFFLGVLFGSIVTGIVVHKHDMKLLMAEPVSQTEAETIRHEPYGSGDNRVLTDDTGFYWQADTSGFVPLDVPMDEELQAFVYALSTDYDIDWTLVMALIDHESDYRTNVISKTNDYGLMQINVCNHDWLSERLGVTDFLDAKQNIRSGLYVLHWLFQKYDGNVHKVLMAYNMGENTAERLWDSGVTSTAYSRTITEIQAEYQSIINGKDGEEDE